MSEKKYLLGESAARRLRAMFREGGAFHPGGGADPVSVEARDAQPPFTVVYSSSYSSAGSWLIYLPAGSWCGADSRNQLTAATSYGDDWYEVPSSILPTVGTTVWNANVCVGVKEGDLYLSSGNGPLAVAEIGGDPSGTGELWVNQLAKSAVARPELPFEVFSATTDANSGATTWTVASSHYRVANVIRKTSTNLTLTINSGDGESGVVAVCLKVPADSTSATSPVLEKVNPSALETTSQSTDYVYLPLYLVATSSDKVGNVLVDLRSAPDVNGGGTASEGDYPFKVVFDEDYSTSGAWLIYLPSGSWCGADSRSQLTAATGKTDWYEVPASALPSVGSTPWTANLCVGAKEGDLYISNGNGPLCVARIGGDPTEGTKTVTQLVKSAVPRLAGAFEVYSSSTAYDPDSSSYSTTWYVAGSHYRVGNAIAKTSDATLSISSGDGDMTGVAVCLRLSAGASGAGTPELVKVSPSALAATSRDLSYSYLPLYLVSNQQGATGNILVDLRGAPASIQFEV